MSSESDERYRAFVATSSEAIWRFELEEPVPTSLDPDEQIDRYYRFGYLAECNEAMARQYGFASPEEIIGARLGDMVVREKPENIEFLRAFIDSGYRLLDAESREVDRDGNEKYFVNNFIAVIEDGCVLRAWGTQRDVTQQRLLLARLQFLAEVTAVLGSTFDLDEMMRAVAAAAVPQFADACFFGEDPATGLQHRFHVPLAAHGRNLGTMTFANESRRFTDEDVLFAEDLGRRVGLAIESATLYRELQRANRAKDEFMAMLSHELRTPMTATLGWASMLQAGGLPETGVRTAIDAIAQSTRAQARLIDDLLDVSRIIAGKMQLSVQRVSLADAIHAAVDTVRAAAEAKQIALILDLGVDELRLNGDPARLQQVFWNLLSNAVKFSQRFGIVQVRLARTHDEACVTVRDDGDGIDPELLPFIFDRFRQGDTGMSRRFGGLGLGLAIARNLVELHGGTLHAKSDGPGKGAEFTLTLPIAAEARPTPANAARTQAPPLAGLRLLVVDDDESTLRMLQVALAQFGAEVRAAGSASEAFDQLSRSRFDVMVSDIGMPGEDGCSLIRRVRQASNPVGAIALTAYASDRERDRALSAGFQTWLTKPIDPAVLAEEVRRIAG